MGCRYVEKSDAFLAMNRFDRNFVISLDGIYNDDAVRYFDAVPGAMEQANIPFTQHWGKHNGYTPARVERIYGSDRDSWIAARRELLPMSEERALFTNDFMRQRGLDQ